MSAANQQGVSEALRNFQIEQVLVTLAAGEIYPFQAFNFLSVVSSTGALEVSPVGSNSYGSLLAHQVYGDGVTGLGNVNIRNNTAGPITATILTCTHRIDWTTSAGSVPVSLDASTITLPVSGPLTDAQLRAAAVQIRHPGTQVRGTCNITDATETVVKAPGAGKALKVSTVVVANNEATARVVSLKPSGAAAFTRVAVVASGVSVVAFSDPLELAADETLNVVGPAACDLDVSCVAREA